MAGILNTKTRIMDVVMTNEGRRQLAAGKFVPMFASFTDRNTFYERDAVSGSADASQYLYFEAGSRQQDQIVIENDDSGLLVPYTGRNSFITQDGMFYNVTSSAFSGSFGFYIKTEYVAPTGSFASLFAQVSAVITSSLEDQNLITTYFPYEKYSDFALSTNAVEFRYNNFSPFRGTQPATKVEGLKPLFAEQRMSHLENFQFLPPKYVVDSVQQNLGDYEPLKSTDQLTYTQLIQNLVGTDPTAPLKQQKVVDFTETSIQTNVFMQMFEGKKQNADSVPILRKLDCIDFGEFKDETDQSRPFKRVFFIGKVYIGSDDVPKYANLFTIVAE